MNGKNNNISTIIDNSARYKLAKGVPFQVHESSLLIVIVIVSNKLYERMHGQNYI